MLRATPVLVYSLFIIVPIVCGCFVLCPFFNTVLSGFAIILLGKRQLVVDFLLSSGFHVAVTVICLALMVP